ncbi:uncharacterized protein K489DRAFT_235404 [Dissoconium aciculare CBS 342.82]|uniref:Uncharacterized protein n=1 Tax=Dissoconium aciculare CBS 342.82 TaxID=1314786 RepID=A0A6J3M3Y5_9PEZI|nr:uncharacterized protein K489DRAFT_235404 [Dissoconium aciculare CBS 342.82]KAF1822194.1 hypothetical protein K489DRAFT_235404 [Dissoconium aciculare CBS 342.82]
MFLNTAFVLLPSRSSGRFDCLEGPGLTESPSATFPFPQYIALMYITSQRCGLLHNSTIAGRREMHESPRRGHVARCTSHAHDLSSH